MFLTGETNPFNGEKPFPEDENVLTCDLCKKKVPRRQLTDVGDTGVFLCLDCFFK